MQSNGINAFETALLAGAMALLGCGSSQLHAAPVKEAVVIRRQSKPQAPKRVQLTTNQSMKALESKALAVATAKCGYETGDPDVVVAELHEGSGIAYSSWVVLLQRRNGTWGIYGKPSGVLVVEPDLRFELLEKGSSRFFCVSRSEAKKGIVLPLP